MDVGLDGVAEWNLDCVDEVLAAGTDRSVTVILHFGTAETEFVGVAVQESLGVAGRIPVHSIEAQFVVLLLLTHFYQIYLI